MVVGSFPVSDSFLSFSLMTNIFKNPEHQAHFDEKGWLIVPLLSPEEVEDLLAFYKELPATDLPDYGFHVSLDKASLAYKEQVMAKLKSSIGPRLEQYFQNYQVFTAAYVVKEHNPKGVVPPHQDWTFVDESKHSSMTVWTALVDTDMDNGCMGVINGSHKYWDYLRASPSPQCKTPISDHMFTLFPYLQLKPMKAGEALIFDNRTIHASPPNTTDQARVAAGIGVTQTGAELFHHYLLPNQDQQYVERYAVSMDWFKHYNNGRLSDMYNRGERPDDTPLVATLPRELPEFSADEILDMIKAHPDNTMNVPLVEKMARLFNYNMDGTKKEEPKPEPAPAPEPAKVGGVRGFLKRIFG